MLSFNQQELDYLSEITKDFEPEQGQRKPIRITYEDLEKVASSLEHGGIDLSQIELILKDDKYISSLNPADIKILRAAKALKEEWNSLFLKLIQANKPLSEVKLAMYQ